MQSKVGNVFLAVETARRLSKDGIISVVRYRKVCFDVEYGLMGYRASILDC